MLGIPSLGVVGIYVVFKATRLNEVPGRVKVGYRKEVVQASGGSWGQSVREIRHWPHRWDRRVADQTLAPQVGREGGRSDTGPTGRWMLGWELARAPLLSLNWFSPRVQTTSLTFP